MTGPAESQSRSLLGGLRLDDLLDDLLDEMRERLAEIGSTSDKMQGLLDAVLAVGAGLELDSTLQRIVQALWSSWALATARWACSASAKTSPSSSTSASTLRRGRRWGICRKAKGC